MTDATHTPSDGPMLTADGIPLKKSLQIALRRQKLRALILSASQANRSLNCRPI